jgi:hypothetical protein
MLLQRLRKFRGSLALTSVPTSASPADESESLAAKYDAQVKWMREKGITGTLDETQEGGRKPARSAPASLMRSENPENPENPEN